MLRIYFLRPYVVAKIVYNPDTKELLVRYTTVGEYVYVNVSQQLWDKLCSSPDIVRFIVKHIFGKLDTKKPQTSTDEVTRRQLHNKRVLQEYNLKGEE